MKESNDKDMDDLFLVERTKAITFKGLRYIAARDFEERNQSLTPPCLTREEPRVIAEEKPS